MKPKKYVQCQFCFAELLADEHTKERKEKHEKQHRRYEGLLSQRDGHKTTNSTQKTKGEISWKIIYK